LAIPCTRRPAATGSGVVSGHLLDQRVALFEQLGHAVDQDSPFDSASVVTPYLEQVVAPAGPIDGTMCHMKAP
jgi:hypothetical protein